MKNAAAIGSALLLLSRAALAQEATGDAARPPTPVGPDAIPSAMPAPLPPPEYAPIPPTYAPESPKPKRRSNGMFIGGIIMTAAGAATAVGGLVDYVGADAICGKLNYGTKNCTGTYRVIGASSIILGGVLVAAGLPIAIIGGQKPAPAERAPNPAPALSLHVGPAAARLNLAF